MTSTKKYVGMDVHKESISIAVMNSVGKIVMECVLETKASMILQFINGLRGDVRVTFEEGTWAAWLYDLLKPHVSEVLVCNPRKNALLKDGSKSDRIDARKLAELLRGNHLKPVLSRRGGLAHIERAGTQLSDHQQGCHAGHESAQGVVSQLGHCVCRRPSVCTTSPLGMAGQDQRSRRPTTRRTLLPAAGCLTSVAPADTSGSVAGKQEAPGMETARLDSWDRPDPGGPVDRADPDPPPVPHQTTPVDL